MIGRSLHKLEEYVLGLNVSVAFIVQTLSNIPKEHILLSFDSTTESIPILGCAIAQKDGITCFGPRLISTSEIVVVEEEHASLPTLDDVSYLLVDAARGLSDISTHLCNMKAVCYDGGVVFLLVVNHAITDGSSVFSIVDTFLQHLASGLDATYSIALPPPSTRDLVGELLSDPRCTASDSTLSQDSSILKFPVLSSANMDATNGGCFRVVLRELDADTTSTILLKCRQHQVGFQSLLSTVAGLALRKLISTTSPGASPAFHQPIGHIIPVNMRRYLSNDEWPVERSSAMASVSLPWLSTGSDIASLARRAFWSYVKSDAHDPIYNTLNSSYLHESLYRGEANNSHGSETYSLVTTSLGQITAVKRHYGPLAVVDMCMQPGFYSRTQEQMEHPVVPASLIEAGIPGHAWIHAYTVFGSLKLSGEYCLYSRDFISQYYDEVVRLLQFIASNNEESGELLLESLLDWIA